MHGLPGYSQPREVALLMYLTQKLYFFREHNYYYKCFHTGLVRKWLQPLTRRMQQLTGLYLQGTRRQMPWYQRGVSVRRHGIVPRRDRWHIPWITAPSIRPDRHKKVYRISLDWMMQSKLPYLRWTLSIFLDAVAANRFHHHKNDAHFDQTRILHITSSLHKKNIPVPP